MKPLSTLITVFAGAVSLLALLLSGACLSGRSETARSVRPPAMEDHASQATAPRPADEVIIAAPEGAVRPPFAFSLDDERFLDEVQRGAFNYLWNAASPDTGMVYDRSSVKVVSVAGVGFQLSAIPI